MSLFVASLNSGSNGNCYYVGDGRDAVLVDVGISCREVERRMKRLELSIQQVRAVFISHEHSDHIRGVQVLSRKHNLPVYLTEATSSHCPGIRPDLVRHFAAHQPVAVGGITVSAFPTWHDAVDPHSFVIRNEKVVVGVFTDFGVACDQVKQHFRACHAAFLECNYDEQLLETGTYPRHLKARINGNRGHLSNRQAAELFMSEAPATMTHVFLSHLSEKNNSPKIVQALFRRCAGEAQAIIASRYRETAVFNIDGIKELDIRKRMHFRPPHPEQLSLW